MIDTKRFEELSIRAFERGTKEFSDFLNIDEQSILASSYLPCEKYGGYEGAERIIAGFGENVEVNTFPISCIKISPVMPKFADTLTHRDFLGGIMSLGIKREMLGDIIVNKNCGWVFCVNHISDYIIENLTKIRHTSVKCNRESALPKDIISPLEDKEIIISSLRLDVLISAVYKLSRRESQLLFKNGRVFINSKMIENNSHIVQSGDIISVRGYGRFIFDTKLKTTKKERLVVKIKVY